MNKTFCSYFSSSTRFWPAGTLASPGCLSGSWLLPYCQTDPCNGAKHSLESIIKTQANSSQHILMWPACLRKWQTIPDDFTEVRSISWDNQVPTLSWTAKKESVAIVIRMRTRDGDEQRFRFIEIWMSRSRLMKWTKKERLFFPDLKLSWELSQTL